MEEDKTKSKNKIYIGIVVALIIVIAICGSIYYYKDYFSALSESQSSISSSTKTSTNKEDSDNETATLTRSVDEKNIEITESGTHELSGEYESVTIKANGNVELKLNNVEITSDDGPAIYVEEAKNVEIVLSGKNKITATTTEDFDGAIYSKADLVILGDGELEVVSNYDGIVSKDTLTIKNGTYTINSEDDGIRGKDNVEIVAGTYTITAAGDGIKSTNDEDTDLGYIKISNGKFNITAGDDAINAITTLTIEDGDFTITAKDDAIHADGMVEIKDGNCNITAAEGIEATYVKIDDGAININASDDGINAGNKSNQYSVKIEINGGKITIKMGQGDTDGIDSNGDIVINGGTIDVTANSAFDYDGKAEKNGGTLIINGTETDTIPNQMMGGGKAGGFGGEIPEGQQFKNDGNMPTGQKRMRQ